MSARNVGEVMVLFVRLSGAPLSKTSRLIFVYDMSKRVVSLSMMLISVLKRTFRRLKPFSRAVL